MLVSNVPYSFLAEIFIFTFITLLFVKYQKISYVYFNNFSIKFFNFKLLKFIDSALLKLKKVNISFGLKWNPIFKKSSYIGYYFSNIKRWQK